MKNENTAIITNYFNEKLKGRISSSEVYYVSVSIAYALIAYQKNNMIPETINYLRNDDNMDESLVTRVEENWNLFCESYNMFTSLQLEKFILATTDFYSRSSAMEPLPEGLVELVSLLLTLNSDDDLLDLCSGTSSLYIQTYNHIKFYTGLDQRGEFLQISKLRCSLLGNNYSLVQGDAITYRSDKKYDKVFANYPFAMRNVNDYDISLFKDFDIEKRPTVNSSDWLFNLSIVSNLKEEGKGCALMVGGAMLNERDKEMRQLFVENGLIETVIQLPDRLLPYTAIPVILVIFSYGNKSIRFIDAHQNATMGRRQNTLSKNNIVDIVNMVNKDSQHSISKSIDEVIENDCILTPKRYFQKELFADGVKLGDFINDIGRGVSLSANVIDEITSQKKTDISYIKLSDIIDGEINLDGNITYLTELTDRQKRQRVKNNSIIISKMGSPAFKCALYQGIDDNIVIPSANFMILEVNDRLVNPVFLQAYLSSAIGNEALQQQCTGSLTKVITISGLKDVAIPNISLEQQNIIADKYLQYKSELKLLRKEIKNKISDIDELFS